MKHCAECGHRLAEGHRYCEQCGTPIEATQAAEETVRTPGKAAAFVWKHKWMLASVAAVVLLLIGSYIYGKYMTGPMRFVERFEDAVRAEDAARVAFMSRTDNAKVSMDESKARTILSYLQKSGLQDDVMKDLRKQAAGGGEKSIFELRKDGSLFGFFDRYKMIVKTSAVKVQSNYYGAVVKLNGRDAGKIGSDDYAAVIGPVVPGIYELALEYTGEFTMLRAEQELTVTGAELEQEAELNLKGETISVDANYTNAAIFIDGKDTGAVTGFDKKIGPVALDGSNSIHVEKKFPWGVAKSESVPITSKTIHLNINPNTDRLKETVMKTVSEFLQSWITAFNALDAEKVKHLSGERKAELASGIEGYKANSLVYDGKLRKLVFDKDSIYIQQEGDRVYRTAVTVQNTYTQAFYSQGDTPPQPSEYTDTITYRLVFQDGKWSVTDWYVDPDFNQTNTHEIKFP